MFCGPQACRGGGISILLFTKWQNRRKLPLHHKLLQKGTFNFLISVKFTYTATNISFIRFLCRTCSKMSIAIH